MTYGELKKTKMYKKVKDIEVCVNGEEPIDEMYFPDELLDDLQVIGTGHSNNGKTLLIDLVCDDWKDRFYASFSYEE